MKSATATQFRIWATRQLRDLPGLALLRDYDEGRIDARPSAVPGWELTLAEARDEI